MKVSSVIRRWKLAAFICGSVIAAVILLWLDVSSGNDPGWTPQLPMVPGYILSIPVYFAAGGVHGNWASLWACSLIPLNGVAYVLIGMLIQRGYRALRSQKP